MDGDTRTEITLDPEGIPPELRWDLYRHLEKSSRVLDLRRPSRIRDSARSVPQTALIVVMNCPGSAGAMLVRDYIADWRREGFPTRQDISEIITITDEDDACAVKVEPCHASQR